MLRRRTVLSRLRKLVAGAAVLTCAAAGLGGIERPSAVAAPGGLPADALPAVFAQGGSSRYRDTIQWLQWADYDSNFAGQTKPNVPVLDYGQRKTFTNYRDMGEAGYLVTTCNLSDLKHIGHRNGFPDDLARGPLVATIPGTWAGDILDNLYNIGGAGGWSDGSSEWHSGLKYPANYVNHNQMVIGLANGYAYNGDKTWDGKDKNDLRADRTPTGGYSRISFDVSCSAALQTPDGSSTPVPLNGLVFADAEASNPGSTSDPFDGEWIQAQVPSNQRVTWRLLDGGRSTNCPNTRGGSQEPVTTRASLSNGNRTLRLDNTAQECVYQNGGGYSKPNGIGGPAVSMFMEGATSATITMQGSGYSAVALGLVLATDFGDAPVSYGSASALLQPRWDGGEVTSRNGYDLFGGRLINTTRMYASGPYLGTAIDAESQQRFSDGADGDDNDGWYGDDEDGVSIPAAGIETAPGQVVTSNVRCSGGGAVAGWIDWNHNGVFDAAEKSDQATCDGRGNATLRWTVPEDVVRSIDGESGSHPHTYMRVRTANAGVNLKPTGSTMGGEVEDYRIAVRVPTIQLVKNVQAPYGGQVKALGADQWTLKAQQGNGDAASLQVTGTVDTGIKVARPGQYALTESSTNPLAPGYEASSWRCSQTPGTVGGWSGSILGSSSVRVKGTDRITCSVTNTTKPGALSWTKVDQDGKTPLGGTTWTLTGPGVPAGTVVEDCQAAGCRTGAYRDTNPAPGAFDVEGLPWGSYSITEKTSPSGYQRLEKTLTFNDVSGANLKAQLKDATGVTKGAVTNQRLTGSVSWKKQDTSGHALSGSEWTLSGPGVPASTTITDCVITGAKGQCPSGPYADTDPAAGSFTVTGLPWDARSYSLVEKRAPAGYRLDSTSRTFVIKPDALQYSFSKAFTNEKVATPRLPLTGGRGAHIFLIAGAVVSALAITTGLLRRRRHRNLD
ncbi:CshA/CshB family fibrillar adhesin-related protein [Actinomyces naeslundii]|uniref:CshA/CshB family fibrillar adhesin-related protein n=1 Tax=Actinomyces naeslundii TaxID=1655 RepID=A0AA47IQ45_ACTNA|nr:CshA/CshB family fibrillar adhesin-related protein [Actinomyces naeslundii]PKY94043.1 fimbrial protein [Actinomyces naeslundii]WAL42979.1 CshA/CshB family fibrillar adhesin-related protein [Actinomyces naeslundii]